MEPGTNERPELGLEALELRRRIDALTISPAAFLLPVDVRKAIRDLARMVERLANERACDVSIMDERRSNAG